MSHGRWVVKTSWVVFVSLLLFIDAYTRQEDRSSQRTRLRPLITTVGAVFLSGLWVAGHAARSQVPSAYRHAHGLHEQKQGHQAHNEQRLRQLTPGDRLIGSRHGAPPSASLSGRLGVLGGRVGPRKSPYQCGGDGQMRKARAMRPPTRWRCRHSSGSAPGSYTARHSPDSTTRPRAASAPGPASRRTALVPAWWTLRVRETLSGYAERRAWLLSYSVI
jgi:hypothetical protein